MPTTSVEGMTATFIYMDRQLYYHIADIIHQRRTWIKVIDTERQTAMRIIVNGEIRTLMFRTLSLRSYRSHYSFQQSRTWHVTEYDIGNAVTALARKDPSAQVRLEACHLTNRDVEYIIEKATFGILKLELDDYE